MPDPPPAKSHRPGPAAAERRANREARGGANDPGGLVPLEAFNRDRAGATVRPNPRPNGIACPGCGGELNDTNNGLVYTTFPAQVDVHCPGCGHKGKRVQ